MNRYFLITDPIHGEHVQVLIPAELPEFYSPAELEQLEAGEVIFRNGALHVDMQATARAATEHELCG